MPLKTESTYAPKLTEQDINNFKRKDFRTKFLKSLDFVLKILGAKYDKKDNKIVEDKKTFVIRAFHQDYGWIQRNFFDIVSRVIESCRILGFTEEGMLFVLFLCYLKYWFGHHIPSNEFKRWKELAQKY